MSELERILDNKPSRPPMISTLALRWQSMCPHGSGGGSVEDAGSPKSEGGNSQDQEQTKEVNNKMPFCEIQWDARTAISRCPRYCQSPQGPTMDEYDPSTRLSSKSTLSPLRSRRRSRLYIRHTRVDDNTYLITRTTSGNLPRHGETHQSGYFFTHDIYICSLAYVISWTICRYVDEDI